MVRIPENSNYADYRIKKVTRDLQYGAERTIGHESNKAIRSGAVRRVFTQDGKIIGCRIVYVIFLIIVIA